MNIDRRDFFRKSAVQTTALATALSLTDSVNARPLTPSNPGIMNRPTPTPGQVTWQEAEVGLIYHYDISVAAARFEKLNNAYREKFNPNEYNPTKLDTDQWISAATAAGAKYAVFTATHFNGFLQWQSDAYPYGLKQAKWKNGKGDVFGDFVKSCHRAGILPGVYISTHRNGYWDLWDYYVDGGKGRGTPVQEEFNRAAEKMVEELSANYGPLVQIWFDAGTKLPHEGGPDVIPIFEKHQPDSVFYHATKRSDHRWIGNEAGHADYPCWATMPGGEILSHNSPAWRNILGTGDPAGEAWSPGMVDVPFRGAAGVHNWFWAPGQDHTVYAKEALVDMYYKSVGRNANLILGEVVTPEGLVPESDILRLQEFGDEIKARFSKPLARTHGSGESTELHFGEPQRVNHVILQEDIKYGERVRAYRLEGLVDGSWKLLASGQSVGQKRIERFDSVDCRAVRVLVKQSTAEPLLKNFAAFRV